MASLRLIAWFFAVIGAVLLIMTVTNEYYGLITPALTALISSVVFFAADKALVLLTEIRDAISQPLSKTGAEGVAPDAPSRQTPTKSLKEIEADIERLRAKS